MVSSTSLTLARRRSPSSGLPVSDTAWSCIPTANSRWMTVSWRSRAMRSRSDITARSSRSPTASARSRARAGMVGEADQQLAVVDVAEPRLVGVEDRDERAARRRAGPGAAPRTRPWCRARRRRRRPARRRPRPSGRRRPRVPRPGRRRRLAGQGPHVAVRTGAHHGGRPGPPDPPRGRADLLQREVPLHRRLQGVGQTCRRLEPLAAALAEAVGAGVLDHQAGGARERDHEPLVGVGEVAATLLLGQVEVAEDGAADVHGDAEERRHRRVVRREAVRRGVLGQVGEPEWPRFGDQQAQDAAAVG